MADCKPSMYDAEPRLDNVGPTQRQAYHHITTRKTHSCAPHRCVRACCIRAQVSEAKQGEGNTWE